MQLLLVNTSLILLKSKIENRTKWSKMELVETLSQLLFWSQLVLSAVSHHGITLSWWEFGRFLNWFCLCWNSRQSDTFAILYCRLFPLLLRAAASFLRFAIISNTDFRLNEFEIAKDLESKYSIRWVNFSMALVECDMVFCCPYKCHGSMWCVVSRTHFFRDRINPSLVAFCSRPSWPRCLACCWLRCALLLAYRQVREGFMQYSWNYSLSFTP